MGMREVQQNWNGVELLYVVNYHDKQPCDFWSREHVMEIRKPGLHAPYEVEMQEAATMVNASPELPPCVTSNELHEPNCPNPYLGMGDAPEALVNDAYLAEVARAFPASKHWNPYVGPSVKVLLGFEPVDAWKLVQKDPESIFSDYFFSKKISI